MKRAPMSITEEETKLIRQSLILPIVLDVLAHDIRVLQHSSAKMNAVYVRYLHALQDQVSLSLYQLRRRMKRHGIKMLEQKRGKLGLEVEYICRGYEHRVTILWAVVRGEVELVLETLTHTGAADKKKPVYV